MAKETMPPPAAAVVEMSIIASFMSDAGTFARYRATIEPEMFYVSGHRSLIEYMLTENVTDMVVLGERFPDRRALIADCMATASYVNLCAQIDILKDRYYRRCIITASQNAIAEACENYDTTAQEIAEKTTAAISINDNTAAQPEHIKEIIPRALAELQDSEHGGAGINTGLIDIDETMGYMYPGDYVIIAGRPGTGKSSLMATIVRNMSIRAGVPTLIFSLEMSKALTTNRIIFGEAGAALEIVANRKYGHAEELKKTSAYLESIGAAPIYIDDQPGLKLNRLVAITEQYRKRHGVKIIFVDHMQLMGMSKGRSRNEEMAEISVGLKNIARKNNIVVVGLSQLSRAVEARKPPMPILSDLRDSGSIEQDADKVLFLYHLFDAAANAEQYQVIIAKNRNGKTGYRNIYWDAEAMRFLNIDKGPQGESRTEW